MPYCQQLTHKSADIKTNPDFPVYLLRLGGGTLLVLHPFPQQSSYHNRPSLYPTECIYCDRTSYMTVSISVNCKNFYFYLNV